MNHPPEPPRICPHCGGPSPWQTPRYHDAVCEDCRGRLTDRHGRAIVVGNTTILGTGVGAHHLDDRTDCVSGSAGEVYIDGKPYTAWEGRFGGIVVRPPLP